MSDNIEIKSAKVNNLKNLSVKIPRNSLVVITGVSGSGKSSLAFDTLYAEGQRRYVESLSSYARQFLGKMRKPECDYINGLPPAIAVEQKVNSRNPRSTVGTSTEVYDYLRALFSKIGHTYSPVSGVEVKKHTIDDVIDSVKVYSHGTRFYLLAPVNISDCNSMTEALEFKLRQGYTRMWLNGAVVKIQQLIENGIDSLQVEAHVNNIDNYCHHDLYLIIDRLSVDSTSEFYSRLTDSCETAFYEGKGACRIVFVPANICLDFTTKFEADGIVFEEPSDNMFSFNSPSGACPRCEGYGKVIGIDEKLVISNSSLSVYEGCVQCWHGEKLGVWKDEFCRRAATDNFPIFKPYFKLTKDEKDMLWHGLPSEKSLPDEQKVSIDSFFNMVTANQYKIQYRVLLSRYRGKTVCDECYGTRLKKEASWVKIAGKSIINLVEMPIYVLKKWFENLTLSDNEEQIAKRLLTEIKSRLNFLCDVGLDYLTLNRASNTLSGGESQRINLATSLGSSLVGSLYVIDEPSIGLHSRDTDKLISVLKALTSIGNSVIVVEHDEEIIRSADYVIDIGPGAGENGGNIVFEGDMAKLRKQPDELVKAYPQSSTIKYLVGAETIPTPVSHRAWNRYIEVKGARMNNLCNVDVRFPLNVMTVVTGVSGSGKSSLVKGILYPALKRHLDEVAEIPGEYASLEGDWRDINHVEFVDQNPIGKSSRSNPATYVKAYDLIRQLYAEQPLARQLDLTAQYFSFNADGGRCDECKGTGVITVEMQFMADLVMECDACHGKRFKKNVLDVKFNDKNIYDVLNMTVTEAMDFFGKYKQEAIVARLKPLQDVGLGYIRLGQNSSSLSGGENQRIKLAYFIGQERMEHTLFIFDEPTTGLHFHDINLLLEDFNALINRGNSIIIVEHNLDVIKCADYVIDLGPDGGDKGGNVVCVGTPEEVASCGSSITGQYLKKKCGILIL